MTAECNCVETRRWPGSENYVCAACQLRAAQAENAELVRLALVVVDVLEQYEAQWGDEYLAEKWGLKEEARSAIAELKRRSDR